MTARRILIALSFVLAAAAGAAATWFAMAVEKAYRADRAMNG